MSSGLGAGDGLEEGLLGSAKGSAGEEMPQLPALSPVFPLARPHRSHGCVTVGEPSGHGGSGSDRSDHSLSGS